MFLIVGLSEYVSKPINLEKFIVALRVFFPEQSTIQSTIKKDILLYKQTKLEAKVVSAILNTLDYSVDVVSDLGRLKEEIDFRNYKCLLLDRAYNNNIHDSLTKHIKEAKIPSLLFIDSISVPASSDEEDYTFVTDKLTDYMSIKEKVDYMLTLGR
jgi:DNA-binding response OmpR family regulator